MTNYDVVKKLIGDTMPKGDASIDYEILENIRRLIELHSEIRTAIEDVAYHFENDERGTVKMCRDEAQKYVDSLGFN